MNDILMAFDIATEAQRKAFRLVQGLIKEGNDASCPTLILNRPLCHETEDFTWYISEIRNGPADGVVLRSQLKLNEGTFFSHTLSFNRYEDLLLLNKVVRRLSEYGFKRGYVVRHGEPSELLGD